MSRRADRLSPASKEKAIQTALYGTLAGLHTAHVPALVLGAPGSPEESLDSAGLTVDVLVPRAKAGDARRVCARLDWKYEMGHRGWGRLAGLGDYMWDGVKVRVLWGVPARPLSGYMLVRLEKILWQRSRRRPEGFLEADLESLVVYLAVQSRRPGYHREEWGRLCALVPEIDNWEAVWRLAAEAGVEQAVRASVDAVMRGAEQPAPGAVLTGAAGIVERAARAIQRKAWPRRLRNLLTGALVIGQATVCSRVGGVEILTGPKVFVPTPDADLLVDMVLRDIEKTAAPRVVDTGSGSGAIAFGIAAARPEAEIYSIELSAPAVRWAERNRKRLRLRNAVVHRGSLIEPLPGRLRGGVDVIVANLPFYPKEGYAAIGSVARGTIEGAGGDGLDLYRQLSRDALQFLRPGGSLVLQMFGWQWQNLVAELSEFGYREGDAIPSGDFVIGRVVRVSSLTPSA